MANRRVCSVNKCFSSKARNPNLTFHRFPKNKDLCIQWIGVCDSYLLSKVDTLYSSSRRICSKHFTGKDYTTSSRKILKPSAVPFVITEENTGLNINGNGDGGKNASAFFSLSSGTVSSQDRFAQQYVHFSRPSGERNFLHEHDYCLPAKIARYSYVPLQLSSSNEFRTKERLVVESSGAVHVSTKDIPKIPENWHVPFADISPSREDSCIFQAFSPDRREEDDSTPSKVRKLSSKADFTSWGNSHSRRRKRSVEIPRNATNNGTASDSRRKKEMKSKLSILGDKRRKFIARRKIDHKQFGLRKNECADSVKDMFQLSQSLKAALVRAKNKNKRLVKEIKKFAMEPISQCLRSNISPLLLQLVKGELRNNKKKPKGRRWSNEDKTLAVAMYKRAPRHYNFLRKLMVLPCKASIMRHLNNCNKTGINNKIN